MKAVFFPPGTRGLLLPFRRRHAGPLLPRPSSSSFSYNSCIGGRLLHLRRKPWQPRRILDPGGDAVLRWNRVFLVFCLVALFVDPLYFYLLYIGGPACVRIDIGLGVLVTFFRTVADLFYFAHMILKFRIAFVAPSSRVFGRGELVTDPHQIAMRYLKTDFVIDLIAMLPIPQIIIWFVIPAVSNTANHTNNTLSMIVLIQYIPRLFLVFALNGRIVKAAGVVAKTAWAGAAYNLLLYMLASHVLGALWYLLSIERQYTCWITECAKENNSTLLTRTCYSTFFDCGNLELPERKAWLGTTLVRSNCDATTPGTKFNFGMFADALTREIVAVTFVEKYLYCLWWGLRNLRYCSEKTSIP